MTTKLAVTGIVTLIAGILWSAGHYPGGYWPLRNFVSELGWQHHSMQAWAFNRALTVSALLMFPAIWLLGRRLGSRVSRAAGWAGVVTMFSAAGLGFAPMDYLAPHIVLALSFFGGLVLTVSLFLRAFMSRYRFTDSPLFVLASGATMAVCTVFLTIVVSGLVVFLKSDVKQSELGSFKRPEIWDIAILEWCVVGALLVWVLAVTRELKRLAR